MTTITKPFRKSLLSLSPSLPLLISPVQRLLFYVAPILGLDAGHRSKGEDRGNLTLAFGADFPCSITPTAPK